VLLQDFLSKLSDLLGEHFFDLDCSVQRKAERELYEQN
jgi:hypothetical protein